MPYILIQINESKGKLDTLMVEGMEELEQNYRDLR
jgi:hypothetical protein